MSGQHWANTNNFVLRAEAEVERAREEIANARTDDPFVAPTQKQKAAVFSSLRRLRAAVNALQQEWNEAIPRKGS